MAYFDGLQVGDKIYSLLEGWTKVSYITGRIMFITSNNKIYSFDGRLIDGIILSEKQLAFWDEVEITPPERFVQLKNDYSSLIMSPSLDKFDESDKPRIPDNSFKHLQRCAKLLALRDELCPDSRGYEYNHSEEAENLFIYETRGEYKVGAFEHYSPDRIYFKTEEDARRIRDILNRRKLIL